MHKATQLLLVSPNVVRRRRRPREAPVALVAALAAVALSGPALAGQTEVARSLDIDGDGAAERLTVSREGDDRRLRVIGGGRTLGEMALTSFPLAPASLSVRKGVLVVEDLTGGTTALAVTYRYRLDARVRRLRLIGLDAKAYSRTNAHDWASVSWNLLTGAFLAESAELIEGDDPADAAYGPTRSRRSSRPTAPVWMERTPDPESLFDGAGEAR